MVKLKSLCTKGGIFKMEIKKIEIVEQDIKLEGLILLDEDGNFEGLVKSSKKNSLISGKYDKKLGYRFDIIKSYNYPFLVDSYIAGFSKETSELAGKCLVNNEDIPKDFKMTLTTIILDDQLKIQNTTKIIENIINWKNNAISNSSKKRK
jgi:hypothetical protein